MSKSCLSPKMETLQICSWRNAREISANKENFVDVVVCGWVSFCLVVSVFLLKYEIKIPAETRVGGGVNSLEI